MGIIIGVFVIGTAVLIRKVKKFFTFNFNNNFNTVNNKVEPDIIYQKDDVVVLKGDAKKQGD